MRPLVIAVLLLSCAGEDARRAPERRVPEAQRARAPAPPRAAAPPRAVADRGPPAAPADPRAATRRAAHDALAEHCGACHEGHRSTNDKALAAFDLDRPDWPGRFDEHRYEAALRRLAYKPAPARAAFVAFRDAERATAPAAPR